MTNKFTTSLDHKLFIDVGQDVVSLVVLSDTYAVMALIE